jgi:hypothetical protein
VKKKPRYLKAQQKWWAISALYKDIHPNTSSRYRSKTLSELRVILVDAADRVSAERIGLELAKEGESRYHSISGDLVYCKFQKIEHIVELANDSIGHGVEVYNDWLVDHHRRRKPLIV